MILLVLKQLLSNHPADLEEYYSKNMYTKIMSMFEVECEITLIKSDRLKLSYN